jgi:hypothetical protein
MDRSSTQQPPGWVSPTGRRISVVDWEDPWAPEGGGAWSLDGPAQQTQQVSAHTQPTARTLVLSDAAAR